MDATPIAYGLVTMPGRDAKGRPEFIPGGCTVVPGLPTRECERCAARYGRVEDEPDEDWDDDGFDERSDDPA